MPPCQERFHFGLAKGRGGRAGFLQIRLQIARRRHIRFHADYALKAMRQRQREQPGPGK